jgi:hypothetical protein
LADILLSKNNTDSCPSGMPKEKDLSIKDLCALYILLDRRLQHRAPKLNRQDDKRIFFFEFVFAFLFEFEEFFCIRVKLHQFAMVLLFISYTVYVKKMMSLRNAGMQPC